VAFANAFHLKVVRRRVSRSGYYWPNVYWANAQTAIPASDQNSDIGIRFSDPDFL